MCNSWEKKQRGFQNLMLFSRFISTDFKVQVKFRTEVLQDRFCDTGYLAEGLFLQRSIFYLDTFQVSLKSDHFSTQVIFKNTNRITGGFNRFSIWQFGIYHAINDKYSVWERSVYQDNNKKIRSVNSNFPEWHQKYTPTSLTKTCSWTQKTSKNIKDKSLIYF